MSGPLLDVRNLSVRYGSMPAVSQLSFSLRQGEVACIVGQNGAGKSSTLAAIAGGLRSQYCQGEVLFRNQTILGLPAEQIARAGVSLIPEGRHAFADMTVLENMKVATFMRRDKAQARQELSQMFELFPRLHERISSTARLLSGGEQQMLVIARGVLTGAHLLLIDEPSLGLAPKVVDTVYQALLKLRDERGLTLLINEQSSNRVMKYADTIHVLRGGVLRLTASPQALADPAVLHEAYFGVPHALATEGVA